jgi:hypothetical protein
MIMGKCDNCKHAIFSSAKTHCSKLKQPVKNVKSCPFFEEEPKIYKLYVRA